MLLWQKLSWQLIKLWIKLQFSEIPQLSTKELGDWLGKDGVSKPILLDARTIKEYKVSHLKNARLASSNLDNLMEGDRIDFATPIVVYCSVGYRSCQIARKLQAIGYQKVFNLDGSIFQWINENRLVYRDNQPVNTVHPYQKFWQYLLLNENIQVDL